MRAIVITILALLLTIPAAASADDYAGLLDELEERRATVVATTDSTIDSDDDEALVRAAVRKNIEELFDAWAGTRWGLGLPQTQTPGEGKINCGMFVGTVLKDAGFAISHKKLQRQPSELIVKTLAPKDQIKRFRNASMDEFLDGVRAMGPGLFVIGLDYHVGFIAVEDDGRVRFIHAGVFSKVVADQDPNDAPELTESRYKVVGKILQRDLLDAWIDGETVRVRGSW